ncbi:YaiO family outer membrane beta-barrel protein [Flectobacillus sp. DC10W]|uniref:YaiO family outer membrane beta-barrel protein n=1 Tax=Flectobacillus longus TaxID=2984207 RepID=A0ABT6YSJ6_9BACT|nr:YaiO family outer membrane beta-barrel protein [Flectobacillus longus]MDI9866515.1 YaiO family outer membrane beta-barrel protein [Flectobacillus longus]
MNLLSKYLLLFLTLSSLCFQSYSQAPTLDSDELFKLARTAAFEQKNYPLAVSYCQQALKKSPDYQDIRVFLGRIYIWTDKTDSARAELGQVLSVNPKNKEALSSMIDLEYWNDHPQEALSICETTLGYYPNDTEILLKKAKALKDLKKFDEGLSIVNGVIKREPQNTEARTLAARMQDNSRQVFATLSYDFFYFDKNYNSSLHEQPWHLTSISVSRGSQVGSFIGRVTHAKRFGDDGIQFEVDGYPRISKTFYSYVNFGYSPNLPVFPTFRNGISLYANLPKSFEGEIGYRYLKFSDETWIYTGSLGKYIGNYWFNLRAFLVPSNSDISQSYTFTTRYYFGGSFDYFSLGIGTGISPDESRNVLLEGGRKLNTFKINLGYSKVIKEKTTLGLSATWFNEDLSQRVNGNQFDIGISIRRKL